MLAADPGLIHVGRAIDERLNGRLTEIVDVGDNVVGIAAGCLAESDGGR